MTEKKAKIICLVLAILILIFAFIEEIYIRPEYLIKCIIKISTFGGVILLYSALTKKKIVDIINLKKPEKIGTLIGGIAFFFVGMIVVFLIFKNQINLSGIKDSLGAKEGFTRENCLYAFAYIIIFNSFLEEAFFRGFLPGLFSKKWPGYIVSAFLFSAYHIGIVGNWFNIPILLIAISGLVLVALFLQWINAHYKTIGAN
ncbi:MAG: CPBP family intramembrane metalloprotease, partial [Lachnospiraceae bacterium]|nr:CPBP family intramembrane metalloprotease [Lachnospiraceae bacterium]